MSDVLAAQFEQAKAGDQLALGRILTHLERRGPTVLSENPFLLTAVKPAFRVGITGPPGAGKSTLINGLLTELRAQNKKVAVLAVDPSSPVTQGAILGDRIRYNEHVLDQNVYIRSLGTRGSLGGLSSAAYLMLRALDACGFDWVIVETVGVGQVEVEIMNVADCVSLVLVPESGDSVQAMKAGLLEISDFVVVNKSDRPGAEAFRVELEAALHMASDFSLKTAEVFSTTATKSEGVPAFFARLLQFSQTVDWQKNRLQSVRLQAEARALLRAQIESRLDAQVTHIKTPSDLTGLLQSF